jgi:hypothetical protein
MDFDGDAAVHGVAVRRAAALAAALAGLASFVPAAHGSSCAEGETCTCVRAEPPPQTPIDCKQVERFQPDQLAAFSPNFADQLVVELTPGISFGHWASVPEPRYAFGGGLRWSFAPESTQFFRIGLGAHFLAGDWAGPRLGNTTLEPSLRLSIEPLFKEVFAVDVFLQASAPIFLGPGDVAGGGGVGGEVRLLNRLSIDLAFSLFGGPKKFGDPTTPSRLGDRLDLGIGYDLWTCFGGAPRPPEGQIQVDFRCVVLAEASRIGQSLAKDGSGCAGPIAALAATASVPASEAMADFFKALASDSPLRSLEPIDGELGACVEGQRDVQRACVDCTKKNLKEWYAYEIDPRQIVEALGCLGAKPADVVCDAKSTDLATRRRSTCGPLVALAHSSSR